ncbi:outer membrane beta-barrel protein [Terasakiella pusilla]|uniref:outer membrane beta-barrel protein n=1 Tax=Terasakiella pusilla TaxID=64973 RepID=UPI003AA93AAF
MKLDSWKTFAQHHRAGKIALLGCAYMFVSATPSNADFYSIGGFGLSATTEVNTQYNDNIYSTTNNEVEDVITNLNAVLTATYRDNNDQIYVTLDGDAYLYSDNNDENNEEYRFRADWRHIFSDSFYIRPVFEHRRLVSTRGNPYENPDLAATDSTVSLNNTLGLDGRYEYKRYSLDFGGQGFQTNVEDAKRGNGTTISHSDRDRTDITGYVQPGYLFMPNTTAYVRGDFLARDYDKNAIAQERDTNGYIVSAGVRYYVPNRLTVDLSAGRLDYTYKSKTLSDTNIGYYKAEVRWWIGDKLETSLTSNRTLSPTISNVTSAIITDATTLNVTYQLLDDLQLKAQASYSGRDYKDSRSAADGSDRWDDFFTAGVGVEYDLNETVALGADYKHRARESNARNLDYTGNITSVFLRASF